MEKALSTEEIGAPVSVESEPHKNIPKDDENPDGRDVLNAMRKYWDPVSSRISVDMIMACEREDDRLDKKLKCYKDHPRRIRLNLFLLILFALVFWIILLKSELDVPIFYIATLVPVIMYYYQVKALERQLIESMIAEKCGWLYDPNDSHEKWEQLAGMYPEIFQKGESGQNVSGQFWGLFNNRSSFWSASFKYPDGSGWNLHTLIETVYVFRLPQKAAHAFTLKPQDFLRQIEIKIKAGLTTEANDFNELFHIDFDGELESAGAGILQVLSPNAQEKLIDFRRAVGPFVLLFRGDVMVVSFNGGLELNYTDFFMKAALDPKDVENIRQRMTTIVGLADAISLCTD
jgi:hypothetical protein